jgi:hypothetical protein
MSLPEVAFGTSSTAAALPAIGGCSTRKDRVLPNHPSRAHLSSCGDVTGHAALFLPAIAKPARRSGLQCGTTSPVTQVNPPALPAIGGFGPGLHKMSVKRCVKFAGHDRVESETSLPVVQIAPSALPAIGGLHYPGIRKTSLKGTAPQAARRAWAAKFTYLRTVAQADIPSVAEKFGADLAGVPQEWLEPTAALTYLRTHEPWLLNVMNLSLLELYAGCGNFASTATSSGLVAIAVDVKAGGSSMLVLNLLLAHGRRVVWSIIVVLAPRLVHAGFPCTFWTPMAHFTRRHSRQRNEETRLRELAHVVFAMQIFKYQVAHGRHASIENPPRSRAWDLDIVRQVVPSSLTVTFDCCCWGACDPGNALPYKKPMSIASTVPLASLSRRCQGRHSQHQRVEGRVRSGLRKGASRATVSGEYPVDLCRAWCEIVRAAIGAPQ